MDFQLPARVLFLAVVLQLAQLYWGWRFWRWTSGSRYLRASGIVVLLLLQAPWIGLLLGRSTSPVPLSGAALDVFRVLSAMWVLGSAAGCLGLVGLWLARSGWRLVAPADRPVDPGRRRLLELTTSGLVATPWLIVGHGVYSARMRHRVERVEVTIPDLPEAFDGFRIVQLTDVHVSEDMPPRLIERFVEIASELDPDLGVLTGDYLAFDQRGLEECVAVLSRMQTRAGILGCLGNHETYTEATDRITREFDRRGVDILRDEGRDLDWGDERMRIVGVDYRRSARARLWNVQKLVRADAPNVLLSHNPDTFPHASELGFDLTLAGHTHGGQVRVEILNKEISPARFMTPFTHGLYRRGGSSLYVSRGVGTTGLPIRLGAPPEISEITLRRG